MVLSYWLLKFASMRVTLQLPGGSLRAVRQPNKTLTYSRKARLLPYRPFLTLRAHNDDLADVQTGQLPHGAAAAQGAAAGAGAGGLSPTRSPTGRSQTPTNYNDRNRGISPVLVLTGAFTAILCGVGLVWLSSTGALSANADGAGQAAELSAAVASAASAAATALGSLLHHLWHTLAEVGGHYQVINADARLACFPTLSDTLYLYCSSILSMMLPKVSSLRVQVSNTLADCSVYSNVHPGASCNAVRLAALLAGNLSTPQPSSPAAWTHAPLAGGSSGSSALEPCADSSSCCGGCAVGQQGQAAG